MTIGGQNVAGGGGGVAIGFYAFANRHSNAWGFHSTALGNTATAIGAGAVAGKKEILDYLNNVWLWYNNQPYYSELQMRDPDTFGTYTEETKYSEARLEEARTKIFDIYKDYFKSVGITSLEQLKALDRGTDVDPILQTLGFQYLLTKDNIDSPVAIGTNAHAMADNTLSLGNGSEALVAGSVGLGAFSRATEADMVADGTKALFSGITFRQSGNLGSDGNANGEYLTGAISIGGPRYVQKNVNGNMLTVQEGNYVRQIKHLADGTHDTDAVNLRQLRGALFNGIKAGDGVTITKQDDPTKPDYGTITVTAANTNTGNGTSTIQYEAGDNVSIKKKEGADNTYVISATNSGGGTDFKVKGDIGEAAQVKSGDTLNINGGATGLSHNANIGVETEKDGLKLRLAKDITTESVTLSKGKNGKSTKMDSESVTINNGKQSTKVSAESVNVNNGSQHTTVNAGGVTVNSNNQAPVSLTSRGLDNGGNRISNVADGVQPHDAVNVSQLNRVKKKMEKHSDAGTAAAIAVGNLPHAMHSGKSMIAIAGGSYGGESAVAIGVSHTNEKGNVILKLSGTSDSNGKYGVGAGVGYEF
ncbi:YadA family autotransporter adhesin [Gallibacterium genomosp. 1]|uniref:YadA family autotransporter adhesin n=1 Tax=Gallibacterium genomosp. 1 TaxID=155515 RepID=UPI000802687B|nr:YadA-like family protein [Gallibacterium genomosp. 1]OBX01776.1 hypothetical protein QV04_04645 [Gallibacterium genomosp. 1]